ncbi:alpha-N-arabinofuranosidase [Spartobacteria bacterium LR76]|nr:alpha-N-arabinofuranosidase [Spartobacteria bacterium LR76]
MLWISDLGAFGQAVSVKVDAVSQGKPISPDLVGIFFEDLSNAADGGLYAELVQNRDFEYTSADRAGWNPLTSWELVEREGGSGMLAIASSDPLNSATPHYAELTVESQSGLVGLQNEGFDGIPVQTGERYDISMFTRRIDGAGFPITVRLESATGKLLGEVRLPAPKESWTKSGATITANSPDDRAHLVILTSGPGRTALDFISLFPEKTFRNRANGLRADLAQVIADLKPKFMRFPGGCLVHGDGLGNIYHWKDSIGPVEQRKGQRNIWKYHQSVGLGYFEYFQFCEDIGAKPLPVVAAGVCCQNSNASVTGKYGRGQQGLPMDQMPGYIQDVLDLIEYANGPATSTWGAKRAAAGHPAPFGLQYLAVGNEDQITPVFRERFQMIYEAVKAKHPEITVIGTAGPMPTGADYDNGWKFADELRLPMVDEHCYKSPHWFWKNLRRYDAYDRSKSQVYLGEWASFDDQRRPTLRSAISEAAYLTALERNADLVRFASYAPLLAKREHPSWNPNLIYFSNTEVCPTINYQVQKLFSWNGGDVSLPTSVSLPVVSSQRSIILGTWGSQCEVDDIRLARGAETLASETFDVNGAEWKIDSGTWDRADGRFRQSSLARPALACLQVPLDGDVYTLALKARKTGGGEGIMVGVGTFASDDYYWWNLGGWGNTQHGVQRTSGGVRSLVGSAVPGRIEQDRWYDIKIEADGQHTRFYLDGNLVHEVGNLLDSPEVRFAASCVRDSAGNTVILKLVNGCDSPMPVNVEISGARNLPTTAETIVLAGPNPKEVNSFENPGAVLPRASHIPVGPVFNYEAPANSLSIVRITQSPGANLTKQQ